MAGRWFPRIVTLALWALVALCASFWYLRWLGSTTAPMAIAALASSAPASDPADLARVLGPPIVAAQAPAAAAPAAPAAGSRFALLGVVANRTRRGVALIAIDGKAARPYRVGSPVDDGYTLQSVALRSAILGSTSPAKPALTLELPGPANTAAAIAAPASAPRTPLVPARIPLPGPVG